MSQSFAAAVDPDRDLFDRIGTMLFQHRLEPTPGNYALAHRYLTGHDQKFNALVDSVIEERGELSAVSAAAIIAQRSVELSAIDLHAMAEEAQTQLAKVSEMVQRSSHDQQVYGEALATNAAELEAGAPPDTVVPSLMELTSSMIERTRTVEEDLRQTSEEMRQLRESLAEAQDKANRDALTGLPNRRALDSRLATAAEAVRTGSSCFTIAICDIDHFKLFNDTYGHPIGDEVIKFVAASLSREQSARLFAARYGGEEFVVVFEGLNPASAAKEIDAIRDAMSRRDLKVTATGQSLGRLTFSAGIAGFDPGEGPSSVLKRADVALYTAKRGGRNRVELG